MTDLQTQMHDYLDETSLPVDVDELIRELTNTGHTARPLGLAPSRRMRRRPVLVLAIASLVTLLVIGAFGITSQFRNDEPDVIDVPPTIVTSLPTTTVTPTTAAVITTVAPPLSASEALSETRIAFHTSVIDGSREFYDIHLMDVEGTEKTRLFQTVVGEQTLTDDSAADWSPDGSKLVFTSLRDEVGENWNYEIYVMNADGSDQRRLTDAPGVDAFADWSPDGSRIIFEREGSNGTRDIWMMNADGTSQVNLTDDPDHDDISASWSPDGTRIAFASDRDALPGGCEADCNLDVYVMTIDGSDLVRLTEDPATDAFPEWSPDGSRVLFHSNRAENWDVFVMNADGTGYQLNLTRTPAMDAHAVWSPDGTRIAFNSSRDGNIEIYLMDPDGANLTRITNTPQLEELWPSWSPIP